jgi:hypothetical protein
MQQRFSVISLATALRTSYLPGDTSGGLLVPSTLKFVALSLSLLPAGLAYGQGEASTSSTGPVAYVYVARPTHIDGFAASSSGKLTPVPGSPFANTEVTDFSVTKKFLFGLTANGGGNKLTSYAINSKGSLTKAYSIDPANWQPEDCAAPVDYPDLQVDSTGSTIYVQQSINCQGEGVEPYLSFHIESNGDMQYLGGSGGYLDDATQGDTARLHFISNGKYGYDGECQEDNGNLSDINIYKRGSNGLLSYIGQSNVVPAPGSNGYPFCAGVLAPDDDNHLAVALQAISGQGGDNGPVFGYWYLASYTAESNGTLTTKSTAENMPQVVFAGNYELNAMSIDPTSKFLAVGTFQGFQIFHFNGSGPITTYSELLADKTNIQEFGWDKSNHLYALGSGKLYVYTVTSSEIKEASGSPYSIPESTSVIVLDE